MKNIEQAFANHTHVDKIRLAKFVTHTINSNNEDIKAHNGKMNTLLGLLAKGDINCAGSTIDPNGDLFAQPKKEMGVGASGAGGDLQSPAGRPPRQASEIPAGVIRTEAEKQKAEEERRRQQEEEERLRREEEEAERQRIAAEKRENSAWNKFGRWIKKAATEIVKEE